MIFLFQAEFRAFANSLNMAKTLKKTQNRRLLTRDLHLLFHLFFRLQPVPHVIAVRIAPLAIEFIRALPDRLVDLVIRNIQDIAMLLLARISIFDHISSL
jgi:hypothetical protein